MRFVVIALAALYLAAIQGCSEVALRENAAAVSFARVIPKPVAGFVAMQAPGRGQSRVMRYVLGNWALSNDGVPGIVHVDAAAFARSLPDGPDRDVLEARIAEKRGDTALAISKYLDAGDLASLESHVDAIASGGRVMDALALQNALLARLSQRHAQNDTIAEATYRLGLVDQSVAYAQPPGTPARDRRQRDSRDAYARAFALAPLEDRYGLALANQDLNVGDLAAARATFARVRELDPASIDPLTGLADAAIRARDFAAARAYLDQAETLSPGAPSIARMRARLPAT